MDDLKRKKESAQKKLPIINTIDNWTKYAAEDRELAEKLSMDKIEEKCLEFYMAKMEKEALIEKEKKEAENKLIEQKKIA